MNDEDLKQTRPLRITQKTPHQFCSQCGAELPQNGRFCALCGSRTGAPISRDNQKGGGNPNGFLIKAGVLALAFAIGLPVGRVVFENYHFSFTSAHAGAQGRTSIGQKQTVLAFYEDLNRKDYKSAYHLLSPRRQRELPFKKWVADFGTTRSQSADVAPGSPNAYHVKLTAVDTSDAGPIITIFDGRWKLVRDSVNARWMLDESTFQKTTSSYFDPRHLSQASTISETYAKLKPSLAMIGHMGSEGLSFGTGFCIASNESTSYFLTNHHVVGDEGEVKVVLAVGPRKYFDGRIVKIADSADAAIIAIDRGALPVALLSNGNPREGTHIGVAGYPDIQLRIAESGLGLTPSLHEGTINAFVGTADAIEFDALTDHGNSGGPLFDAASGQVYGIVTWGLPSSQSQAVQNNFAISIPSIATFIRSSGISPWSR